jgi:hypothetical protein
LLREAHARWLASLELRPLLAELCAAGRLTVEQRGAIDRDHDGRAVTLAALAG